MTVLGELDLHLLGEGRHERLWERLGAHPLEGEDEIKPNASFIEDLGADSLDIVELVMGLEEEFGINIPDDQAEKIKTEIASTGAQFASIGALTHSARYADISFEIEPL